MCLPILAVREARSPCRPIEKRLSTLPAGHYCPTGRLLVLHSDPSTSGRGTWPTAVAGGLTHAGFRAGSNRSETENSCPKQVTGRGADPMAFPGNSCFRNRPRCCNWAALVLLCSLEQDWGLNGPGNTIDKFMPVLQQDKGISQRPPLLPTPGKSLRQTGLQQFTYVTRYTYWNRRNGTFPREERRSDRNYGGESIRGKGSRTRRLTARPCASQDELPGTGPSCRRGRGQEQPRRLPVRAGMIAVN